MSEALVHPVWLAAAHHVGRAEHDEVTGLGRLARGFLVDRKFGDVDALRPKCPSLRRAFVVVREHPHPGIARNSGEPRDRGRHVVTAGNDTLYQAIEFLVGYAAALHHLRTLPRLGGAPDDGLHVVVEREQIDASVGQPLRDGGFGIEIVGLVAQVEAGVGGKPRPQAIASSSALALSPLRRPGSHDQVVA
jgi:hypothetical protein